MIHQPFHLKRTDMRADLGVHLPKGAVQQQSSPFLKSGNRQIRRGKEERGEGEKRGERERKEGRGRE